MNNEFLNNRPSESKRDLICENIRARIISGEYPSSHKFPPDAEFAKQLNVAKATLSAAMKKLEEQGLVKRMRSKGTFVKSSAPQFPDGGKIITLNNPIDGYASPYPYINKGISHETQKRRIDNILIEPDYLLSNDGDKASEILKGTGAAGIIALMSGFMGHEKIFNILKKSGLPVVIPHAAPSDRAITGFACIRSDYHESWKEAVRFICSRGHERIATIALKGSSSIRTYSEKTHLQLLKEHGARLEHCPVGYLPYDAETVKSWVKKICSGEAAPTVFLCFSDFFATYIYEALSEIGARIPEDIAVMGYCGYPGAKFLSPPLATIDFEYHKCGSMAVDVVCRAPEWFGPESKASAPDIISGYVLRDRESMKTVRLEKEICAQSVS